MAHQVIWTKTIVEEFIKEACLSEEEEMIMRTRAKGWTITQQMVQFHMGRTKVNNIIKRLKAKYDQVARYDPLLPPRKCSAEETYMDNN